MARNALGRGLSALIREPEPVVQTTLIVDETGQPKQVDIDLIDPSPYQPRVRFREESLEELAQSIRSSGIIQPLVLRKLGARYQLIAGERRWRAAQRAGLHKVPAVLRDVPEEKALELTLVENIQREDLNPIEQARAFERLMNDFSLTQEDIAARTGKDRTTVANAVRLLRLDAPIQEMIAEGKLSAGHGRALLAIESAALRMEVAQRAAKGALTVRHVEAIASRKPGGAKAQSQPQLDANMRAAIEELERALGTKVALQPKAGKRPGRLVIEYYDDAQLQGLYERLTR